MTDTTLVNSLNSDQTPIVNDTTMLNPSASSDTINASLEQAATALVQYVQTVMAPSDGLAASDNTQMLHEMATTFMQQTAAAISTSVTEGVTLESNPSDNTISPNLKQATSSFVENLGDLLINPQASDTDPAALMKDVQEIWKSKSTTDTVASTAASIWESVKESQHLPVIAGMLASVIFKKK